MSETDKLIESVKEIIGEEDSRNDWRIKLQEHAALYENTAPSLVAIMKGSKLRGLAKAYATSDNEAIKAQNKFKSTVKKASLAAFLTSACGALLLVCAGLHILNKPVGLIIIVGTTAVGMTASVFATLWFNLIKGGGLNAEWVLRRSRAEKKRLDYFQTFLKMTPKNPEDQLFALEYTRRFLLENQITYFEGRGKEHKKAADKTLKKSLAAMLVASLITMLAGPLALLKGWLSAIAGLGVIATAYGAFVNAISTVNLDKENAQRYTKCAWDLDDVLLEIDECRSKAAEGNPDSVVEFFQPVFKILEVDQLAFSSDGQRRDKKIDVMSGEHEAAAQKMTLPQGKQG
jgi:hypothetical protein